MLWRAIPKQGDEKLHYSLTHHIQLERRTAALAFRVVPDARVISGRGPGNALQHQRVVAYDDALRYVVRQSFVL